MFVATEGAGEQYQTPQTRADLQRWIRDQLSLSADREQALLNAVDQVFLHYERVWRASKDEALHAVAGGFAQRLSRMRDELNAREATTNNVARYFEQLVDDLTERSHRDVKTQLLNFRRFMEHVQMCLAVERRGAWCAIGVADITSFKAHNDTLGHAAGDRILERVAHLLRSEVRSSDIVGYQQPAPQRTPAPLHGRFGGDEFCFFLSDLENAVVAYAVAERFWQAVAEYDWSIEERRLSKRAVNVDIGVVCLRLPPVNDRPGNVHVIANELFARADERLYAVKRGTASHISCGCVQLDEGRFIEVDA